MRTYFALYEIEYYIHNEGSLHTQNCQGSLHAHEHLSGVALRQVHKIQEDCKCMITW